MAEETGRQASKMYGALKGPWKVFIKGEKEMGKKKDFYAPADLPAEEKERWVQLSRLMYYDLVHPAVYDLGDYEDEDIQRNPVAMTFGLVAYSPIFDPEQDGEEAMSLFKADVEHFGFTLKRAFEIASNAWEIRYNMSDIARAIDERFPGALAEDWEYDEKTDSFIAVSNM